MSDDRTWLRHVVATLAYRSGKVLANAPQTIADLRVCPTSRSTIEIVAHINDLLEWAHSSVSGNQKWNDSKPSTWNREVERFYHDLQRLDEALSKVESLNGSARQLFQGPLADALTHLGQIATLRRLAGAPVRGENYFIADIQVGRVGQDQSEPGFEFD